MALGITLVREVGSRRDPADVFLGGNSYRKHEDCCLGEKMGSGSSDVCFAYMGVGRDIHWYSHLVQNMGVS